MCCNGARCAHTVHTTPSDRCAVRRNPNPAIIGQAERSEVIALALKVGASEAAKRTGHKAGTIRQWVKRAHDTAEMAPRIAAVLQAVPEVERPAHVVAIEQSAQLVTAAPRPTVDARPWREQRPDAVQRLASIVHRALDAAEGAIDLGDAKRAQHFTTTAAIAIDKAQLLTGEATRRTETESRSVIVTASSGEVAAEVARLRAELGVPAPKAIETTSHEEPTP